MSSLQTGSCQIHPIRLGFRIGIFPAQKLLVALLQSFRRPFKFPPGFVRINPYFLQESRVLGAVPMQLQDLIGVSAHRESGYLRIGHHGNADFAVVRLGRELALIQRGDAAGVMGDRDIRIRFLLHDFYLAQRGERPRKIPRNEDVPEPETAAVEPCRVVGHFNAERLERAGDDRGTLGAVNLPVVNRIFGNQLVVVAGRMNRGANHAHVTRLKVRNPIADGVNPLAVVHDFLGNNELLSEARQDAADLPAQLGAMNEFLPYFLVMAEAGAAMDDREEFRSFGLIWSGFGDGGIPSARGFESCDSDTPERRNRSVLVDIRDGLRRSDADRASKRELYAPSG